MSVFKIYGVQVQAIVIEEDDDDHIVGQHVLPADLVMHPHGLNVEAYIQRKLAELKPKNDAEPPGRK